MHTGILSPCTMSKNIMTQCIYVHWNLSMQTSVCSSTLPQHVKSSTFNDMNSRGNEQHAWTVKYFLSGIVNIGLVLFKNKKFFCWGLRYQENFRPRTPERRFTTASSHHGKWLRINFRNYSSSTPSIQRKSVQSHRAKYTLEEFKSIHLKTWYIASKECKQAKIDWEYQQSI